MSKSSQPSDAEWPEGVRASIPPNDVQSDGFDRDLALAMLLLNHVCSVDSGCDPQSAPLPETRGFPVWVNCSDIFVWGSSDAEILPYDQLEPLYTLWRHGPHWSGAIWCMIARKEMPQRPVEDVIRSEGIWDLDALKAEHGLRANYDDGLAMVEARQKYTIYCQWENANGRTPMKFDPSWWEGWQRFADQNSGWETDEWKATIKTLKERFESENGYK